MALPNRGGAYAVSQPRSFASSVAPEGRRYRGGPRLPLRVVIGALCAFLVLVVAGVTLAITYTVALNTVRDVGAAHAKSLASLARTQTEAYFDAPASHLDALAANWLLDDWHSPASDPSNPDPAAVFDKMFVATVSVARDADFAYHAIGVTFDDASGTNGFLIRPDVFYWIGRSSYGWPARNMTYRHRAINTTTGREFPDPSIFSGPVQANADSRFAAYELAKSVVGNNPAGMWYSTIVYVPFGAEVPHADFVLPAGKPIVNRSGVFIGMVMSGIRLNQINRFLEGVKGTPHTEVFAIDGSQRLVASTHAVPSFTMRQTNTPQAALSTGCASTLETSFDPSQPVFVGCRVAVSDFDAYPPLQRAAEVPGFLSSRRPRVVTFKDGSSPYIAVSTPVTNAFRFWAMNIVLCMPEADVVGNVVAGRNLAIGVTAAVFVVAAAASFGLVYVLLQPLSTVSERMLDTASLREAEGSCDLSPIAEIQDMQIAYSTMSNALQSFARYVPRDVVKELLSSGQLCTIQMTPATCTIMFVDIAGFTSVCERVSAAELSSMVTLYFDFASSVVMEHDGLVDKFIGDCVMAVWGAPFTVANHEVKATLAALLIERETNVAPLRNAWDGAGEALRIRAGISTGEVLAGNMGSLDRMSYTVIGDPVNLASRIESLNKQFGTRVAVSETTAAAIGEVFLLRLLMPIAVVGKAVPVHVYEVAGLRATLPAEALAVLVAADRAHGWCDECGGATPSLLRDTTSGLASHDVHAQHITSEPASPLSNADGSEDDRPAFAEPATDGIPPLSHKPQVQQPTPAHQLKRRSKKSTEAMLRHAINQTAHDCPIVASATHEYAAAEATAATRAFLEQDYASAMSRIDGVVAFTQRSRVCEHFTHALTIVRERAERCLLDGVPGDFDGVYRAEAK